MNPRPSDYKSDALPTELSRLYKKIIMVRVKGLEPPRLTTLDPKSSASANSATPAQKGQLTIHLKCLVMSHVGFEPTTL